MKEKITGMDRNHKIIATIAAVSMIAAGGYALEKYFIPEESIQKDESLPGQDTDAQETDQTGQESDSASQETQDNMEVLKQGEFTGKAGHDVSGTVKIIDIDGEKYLRFENYEQTQGPDVFLYLTESTDPDSSEEISKGVKIRIDGGPDGGEITKEGNFNQKIPEDVNVDQYSGVGVWCDAFSVPFGAAELQ